ncbi:SdpI family protein [Fictibacillus norfolkensis]|uniref:SdpI family protein n=1 Tax=Fictibacillus norfolkensis TaxID=2762233 RepID=A0ABR8SSN3_9BACL|nr:SdpI family protein [Fictibacillus norfolkensis]MBD7966379.1 SdpI family protein [Fictibacillus norfolkensis]
MKKYGWSYLLIALSVLIGVFAYPYLPDQMPMHWNINGEVDGYWDKQYAAFFPPLLMIVLMALFIFMPRIDPKKENYKKFSGSYTIFITIMNVFFLLLQSMTISYGLGVNIDISLVVNLGIGLLFIILGNYLPRIKHNYFIGVRTPWTLANEKTWRKTHQLSGKLFVVAGILLVAISFLPGIYKFTGMLVVVVATVLISTIASYIFYNQNKNVSSN